MANDLQTRDLQLRVQRSFRRDPGADTLLRLLPSGTTAASYTHCELFFARAHKRWLSL